MRIACEAIALAVRSRGVRWRNPLTCIRQLYCSRKLSIYRLETQRGHTRLLLIREMKQAISIRYDCTRMAMSLVRLYTHIEDNAPCWGGAIVRALANRNLWGCACSSHALWKQYSRILTYVSTLLAIYL